MSNVIITRFYVTLEETVWTYVAVRNGSCVLYIIVEKVNKLLVCLHVITKRFYMTLEETV